MTSREQEEYSALRATIRARGTVRTWIFAAGLSVWASLALTVVVLTAVPLATVFPLVVLAATFEAVFSLHVGVERVGRYLQVFHGDRWEDIMMGFGAPLAGTGADPLFALIFGIATFANLLPALFAGPMAADVLVIAALHAALLLRILIARRSAGRQRGADLRRFEQMKARTLPNQL